MINNMGPDKIEFVNYFPTYFQGPLPQNTKEEEFIINDSFYQQTHPNSPHSSQLNAQTIENEKTLDNKIDKTDKNTIPVNLMIEEGEEIKSGINNKGPFGPTNIPTDLNQLYINPRYL